MAKYWKFFNEFKSDWMHFKQQARVRALPELYGPCTKGCNRQDLNSVICGLKSLYPSLQGNTLPKFNSIWEKMPKALFSKRKLVHQTKNSQQ